VQRSGPTPPGGVEAELVVVEEPERAESYATVDVRGKLVLVRGDLERIRQLAVVQGGAIGIVTDAMWEFPPVRTRMDIPDARMYSSFWWGDPAEPRCFGFVLSPRQGEWLRGLARRCAAEGQTIRLKAEVKARFYAGAIEDVEAVLRGTGQGEVLVVAHLCHPQWSANDNASGCGAAIEAARVLAKLIDSGTLPRPRRSIRFLLVPEMARYKSTTARRIMPSGWVELKEREREGGIASGVARKIKPPMVNKPSQKVMLLKATILVISTAEKPHDE